MPFNARLVIHVSGAAAQVVPEWNQGGIEIGSWQPIVAKGDKTVRTRGGRTVVANGDEPGRERGVTHR